VICGNPSVLKQNLKRRMQEQVFMHELQMSRRPGRGSRKATGKSSLLDGLLQGLRGTALLAGGRGGKERLVDVRKGAALDDSDVAEKLGELLVVADGELDVPWNDARLLVVASGVAGELKHLGDEVLKHRGGVHGCAGADALRVLPFLQVAREASHGKLQARFLGARNLLLCLLFPAALTPPAHRLRGSPLLSSSCGFLDRDLSSKR